jgi:hypothetical protein
MTWEQQQELRATGLFDIESHTYWHPNFRVEKRRRPAEDYREFIVWQFNRSREMLEHHFATDVIFLAWPYGIYDDELISAARKAGYIAAFTLDRREATRKDDVMAIPRVIVSDCDQGKAFQALLARKSELARKPVVKHLPARYSRFEN